MSSPSELIAAVNTELRINTGSKIWDNPSILGYINQAIRRVETDLNFETNANAASVDTTPVLTGTIEYDQPDEFGQLEVVQFNDGSTTYTLDSISFNETRIINPSDVQGKPIAYYLRGDQIGLYPAPISAGTLKVYFKQRTPALELNGSDLTMALEYEPAIVKWAAYLAWSSSKDNRGAADQKRVDYQEEIKSLQNQVMSRDPVSLVYSSSRSMNRRPSNPQRSIW